MKYFLITILVLVTLSMHSNLRAGVLDPNDSLFSPDQTLHIMEQSENIEFSKSQQFVVAELIQDDLASEVLTETELKNALITTDELIDRPNISMESENALLLQKMFV